ncbi:type IV secretion system DNA-binding domain-containing protein [Candidatus Berkelbacteria bacterium]|nr:type IV secretion system DNA-binding domain-containing protein [Candidatus Berkelbacteria bacterium]
MWAGSKKGEPPANLPVAGRDDESDITFLGMTDFRNNRHKFGIKSKDRGLHMYTIGKTGTGKSTLLLNMVIDDIQKGKGVAVVDPHGQLIQDVLERLPPHRTNDVIYFNPADRDHPIGFNLFESVDPDLRNVVASGILSIFKKLWADSWGPRLEYILRNAILALMYYPDTTLLGINRLLTDPAYERRVIRKVTDPVVRDFFENEYDMYDPKFRREAIAPIQNKVGQFLSSSTIRNILGQPQSSFNMREVMDEGKILLLDLSIGRIGEDNASLLGSMLITKIQLAAMSRADIPEAERRDFYLYVDEFQNFATESFAVILSEARKYHLNLSLTNQYIAQMPEVVAKAIFGNVGTIISFRVGPSDAAGLAKEFEPVFESQDLINLDNYHIYVKMAIDGVTRPAFSSKTLPPMNVQPSRENYEKVVRVSRERYASPRVFVEQKIQDWADDVQVKQAQEWRRKIEEREQGSGGTPGTPPSPAGASQPRPEPRREPEYRNRNDFVKFVDDTKPTPSPAPRSVAPRPPAAPSGQGGRPSSNRDADRSRRSRGGRNRRGPAGSGGQGSGQAPSTGSRPSGPPRTRGPEQGSRPAPAALSPSQPQPAQPPKQEGSAEPIRPNPPPAPRSVSAVPARPIISAEDIQALREAAGAEPEADLGTLTPGEEISLHDDRDVTP